MIDVQQIIESAREGMNIETRITEITHPDTPEGADGPAVVAVLVHGENGPEVKLAADVMSELDKRMPGPRRREGRVTLHDQDSFCTYLSRYARTEQSVVYANMHAMTFEAVIDEHPVSDPLKDEVSTAWRGFRAQYTCPRSPEWQVWTANDGKEMKQEQFADFLEARLEDLATAEGFPKPVEMLTVARQLNIRTKGEFRREINPTNGDYILVNKTETTADSTQIPRAFQIAIAVFEGGTRYAVEARVRFTCGEAGPRFSYTLHRRVEVERDAFATVRSLIMYATKLPILAGTP